MNHRSSLLLLTLFAAVAAPAAEPIRRVEQGNLVMENVPEPPARLIEKLEGYLEYRQATFRDWTPEGAMLIGTRFGDVEQVHLVEHPLSDRRQLTFAGEPVGTATYSPGGVRQGFVFLRDVGGDEYSQVYFQPLRKDEPGGPRQLTDGRSLNLSVAWSNGGDRIAFQSNARGPRSYDVYVVDPAGQAPPQLVVESGGNAWYPLDWSPDDKKLLLWNYVSINDSSIHLADLATGNRLRLDAGPGRVGISAAKFSRDGRGVYLVSDRDGEFKQLRYVDLATGDSRTLSGHIRWDVEEFTLSRDGRFLAYTSNEDGVSRLNLLDLSNRRELATPRLEPGIITNLGFDPAGRRLAFSFETVRAPRDVYVYELESGRLTQWTRSETGPLEADSRFVAPRMFRYPTFDVVSEKGQQQSGNIRVIGSTRGRQKLRQIPAFLYEPGGPGPFPVVVQIHGGPESQYRPGFDTFVQFVVNELGYALVAPNVRGSDGYGKSFLDLDNGYRREDAVRDIGWLLEWIRKQPSLDHDRVVVMGGSYGGYLTLASLVYFGERLRGGINTVGISNYLSFLANTSEYRRDLRRVEYGDERDPKMREFLARISPLTHAERIRRPLLVVQGLNDPRVPASESEQLVSRVRANGGQVWYLMAKDEGHGFRKKQNRDVYWQTIASFLDRLGGETMASEPRDREPAG